MQRRNGRNNKQIVCCDRGGRRSAGGPGGNDDDRRWQPSGAAQCGRSTPQGQGAGAETEREKREREKSVRGSRGDIASHHRLRPGRCGPSCGGGGRAALNAKMLGRPAGLLPRAASPTRPGLATRLCLCLCLRAAALTRLARSRSRPPGPGWAAPSISFLLAAEQSRADPRTHAPTARRQHPFCRPSCHAVPSSKLQPTHRSFWAVGSVHDG